MDGAQTREELVRVSTALLLGPLEEDEILEGAPSDTYLTGILWPKGVLVGSEEDDSVDTGPMNHESDSEAGVPGYRAVRPCSIGLTFSTDIGAELVVSLGSTARYRIAAGASAPGREESSISQGVEELVSVPPSQNHFADPSGEPGNDERWIRERLGYSVRLPFSARTESWSVTDWIKDTHGCKDDHVTLHVRRRVLQERQTFTLTLINTAPEPAPGDRKDVASLFQTQIKVRAVTTDDKPVSIKARQAQTIAGGNEDEETGALLYRHVKEYAVGHGVAATWTEVHDGASSVRTEWLPQTRVKGTSASGHHTIQSLVANHPDTLSAGWLSRATARTTILTALQGFADCYGSWIATELEERLQEIPSELQTPAERNIRRCHSAYDRITAGIGVLRESDEAWRAFALANMAMNRQACFSAKGSKAGPLTWRPFQLAYFLMVLPGIVNPAKFPDDRKKMDLLWFPTGGGKTEAYLGLTAFTIFFRRLSVPSHGQHGGVDVLMRYTLRLLTVQQFQRAASLICACDFIRQEFDELGESAISIGLFVGSEATPNRMSKAAAAISEELQGQSPKVTPRQLLACPVCGCDLLPNSYSLTSDETAVEIRCANPTCETARKPLPVLTVDDQIYDCPPSLLVGTVDKFAQLPRREDLRRLFGLDGGLKPELIVQDELHLISGPLGSVAGLYETAIDLLCTNDQVPPKIIGSTATIGHAARQVRALFNREVTQFPPPGFDAEDSFFAVRDESGADRLYLGVSSAGRSPKFTLQAITAATLQGAQLLRDNENTSDSIVDAFWTCVLYFNSLRELGGAYTLLQDDVPRQVSFLAKRLKSSERLLEQNPMELSSRVSSRNLPPTLRELERALSNENDPYTPQPQDSVLASNMISVGVDISRLGLMVVNGQPKSTAEYIQATSRVGRGIDGLVITMYNFGRPRDLSHFEHFHAYHSALYRAVEATSVTPWAPRARDKALHAVFVSLIRHMVGGMAADEDAANFDPDNSAVTEIVDFILSRTAASSYSDERKDTAEELGKIVDQWARMAGEKSLRYWEKKSRFARPSPYLMYSAEDGQRNSLLSWPTPNSMREVEPSTAFALKQFRRN